jgi:hypothetical protein
MPLTGKYLKYSPEITLEIFTLIWNKLIENGWKSLDLKDNYKYFVGKYSFLTNNSGKYFYTREKGHSDLKGKIETTVQEILVYDPYVKEGEEEFVLQPQFYVQLTEENYNVIVDWHKKIDREGYRNYTVGSYYGVYENGRGDAWSSLENAKKYQIITFDQFKQYVLKSENVKEAIIPAEYVECIGLSERIIDCWANNFEISKIYETTDYSLNGKWYKIKNFKCPLDQFKSSTKEAFDAQNQPKSIEKWSVGSYVVFLEDNLQSNGFKKGNICKIIRATTSSILYENGCQNSVAGIPSVADYLKWFTTKSEAEVFAKTLVKPVKETPALIEFPKEGYCEKNSDILKYLSKTRTIYKSAEGKETDNRLKYVCWNETDYWLVYDKSSKTYYNFTNILFLIQMEKQPLKQAVHCTSQEEWDFVCDKIDSSLKWDNKNPCRILSLPRWIGNIKFCKKENIQILSFQEWKDLNGYKSGNKIIDGKWYKKENNYYIKCHSHTVSLSILSYEVIYNGKFESYQQFKTFDNILTDKEVSIEEIQQYLPAGHPDKIQLNPEFKVGDWVIRIIENHGVHYFGRIFQISKVHEDRVECESDDSTHVLSSIRHATPEEINNHLISIGQIPGGEVKAPTFITNLEMGVIVKEPFYGITGNPCKEVCSHGQIRFSEPAPMTKDNWKHKMTLSIDDEELPMVNIIKTKSINLLKEE